jgi:hypothetical protein
MTLIKAKEQNKQAIVVTCWIASQVPMQVSKAWLEHRTHIASKLQVRAQTDACVCIRTPCSLFCFRTVEQDGTCDKSCGAIQLKVFAKQQALEENIITALTACESIAHGFDDERTSYQHKVFLKQNGNVEQ